MNFFAALLLLSSMALSADLLPDKKMTPGATVDVAVTKLCVKGYAGNVRDVTESEKNKVYARYGIKTHAVGEYEIDHLISLELGGSNAIENLWPQSYHGTWNAHVKDALEDRLHARVCAGTVKLADAQRALRTDWIAEYKRVFKVNGPIARQ